MKCLVCVAVMGKSFQHSHQGAEKRTQNKLSGNEFSVLKVSFASNSVSAINNMELIARPRLMHVHVCA